MKTTHNVTLERLDEDLFALLDRYEIAKNVSGFWIPIPWASQVVGAMKDLQRTKGWSNTLAVKVEHLLSLVIVQAEQNGYKRGDRDGYMRALGESFSGYRLRKEASHVDSE